MIDSRTRVRDGIRRLGGALDPVKVAGRWARAPRRALNDVRRVRELMSALALTPAAAVPDQVTTKELAGLSARMIELGRAREAADLLNEIERRHGVSKWVLGLRRGLRGRAGLMAAVPPAAVERAVASRLATSHTAPGSLRRSHRRWWRLSAPQPLSGKGGDVESVVRHVIGSTTMISKTLRGSAPRELLVYTSGLLGIGGRRWRAPALYHVEADGEARWHLFLEDLGPIRRLRDPESIVNAAWALGELNGNHDDVDALERAHPWLADRNVRPERVLRPRWAARRLAGAVDDSVARRVEHTFVMRSFHWQLTRLPERRPSGAGGRSRQLVWSLGALRRAPVEANLIRLCDEADALFTHLPHY